MVCRSCGLAHNFYVQGPWLRMHRLTEPLWTSTHKNFRGLLSLRATPTSSRSGPQRCLLPSGPPTQGKDPLRPEASGDQTSQTRWGTGHFGVWRATDYGPRRGPRRTKTRSGCRRRDRRATGGGGMGTGYRDRTGERGRPGRTDS